MKKPKKIILASASPRRKEILKMLKIPFEAVVSGVDENISEDMPVNDYVSLLAKRKGEDVYKILAENGADVSEMLVISCDTVVYFDGYIIGKPSDEFSAEVTLSLLSDSMHSVYSGLCLRMGDVCVTDVARTDVKFRSISSEEIKKYVATGEPIGKAGSYAIQLLGSSFAERIEGDFYNIVGFPVALFTRMLKENFGIGIFDISEM